MRCFIALELPLEIKIKLGDIIGQLKKTGADVKWVDPANIHLTLKFLGETPEADALRAGLALSTLKGKFKAIDSGLGGLGAFPSVDRPKVIWAGLSQGAEEIKEIYRQVEKLTADISQEDKAREFSPHLTLGRVRSNKNLMQLRDAINQAVILQKGFEFNRLVLLKSTLTSEGAIYSELNGVELV
ncbi:MAG: 2'-5' RNA ligase [Candidatus Edwardsbacteria bacterium RIFOXYD12_FULL_50_11]|uniref:RNA 2',3'-cyclic phosphodiesterase n=1 Tax=Candidatus Edwardsbacteria bacterium GWF2_54_11 TaxID=1817851 RepID=A0A1F5RJ01_9BACT|nr:MAG: 2'-5' RNA ligase [Candidatus Edwardsbacteria bacterium RifOxyC12_full_54_24]OGF08757.1 MAG: 2'-5' RNA ligase [Candidatus Edwardsbacteria bacterium RifOxyA12_full_54_48]OGF12632.1 MAG: 2'-5' RNA ligase [Candidatus Edwardsbacteria bacterium GWE2_54_12]OGF14365.1 MAG: 2'-5' RNA ligase [Candidatus Edwardsbacteria bacterium GWF2_54_11]OGF15803.1 MAG: 2'-5' RNA ligase [Candidatus Edwardsbacteria bacterium RIFOXYD12_FULL_50_11]OGJ18216.1 MAG: 2'-5' RNA ligase [Candidatus Edwardsbacteria bacte